MENLPERREEVQRGEDARLCCTRPPRGILGIVVLLEPALEQAAVRLTTTPERHLEDAGRRELSFLSLSPRRQKPGYFGSAVLSDLTANCKLNRLRQQADKKVKVPEGFKAKLDSWSSALPRKIRATHTAGCLHELRIDVPGRLPRAVSTRQISLLRPPRSGPMQMGTSITVFKRKQMSALIRPGNFSGKGKPRPELHSSPRFHTSPRFSKANCCSHSQRRRD